MADSLGVVRDLFLAPSQAFERINAGPIWRLPVAIIVIVSFLLGVLLQPFIMKLMSDRLVFQFGAVNATEMFSLVRGSHFIFLAAAPLVILGKCVVISAVLYYAILPFTPIEPPYRTLVSAVVHAELILLLMSVVNLLLVEIRGVEAVHSLRDLQPIVGLEYVCRSFIADPVLLRVLQSVNIFTLWYMGVLACGVSMICTLRKWQASILVVLLWLAMAFVQLFLLQL